MRYSKTGSHKATGQSERRLHRRYELELDMQYVVSIGNALRMGNGRTRDISSGSVLFTADDALPADAYISLSLDWPSRSEQPMWLVLSGRVFRCDRRGVVVLFRRYVLTPQLTALDPELRLFRQFRLHSGSTGQSSATPAPQTQCASACSADPDNPETPADPEDGSAE
jgi:hypothetical protein